MPADWITHRLDPAATEPERLQREWLLTNGTGAYAMGTAGGCNTRRYHGLLVAATAPPLGRALILNQVLDELVLSQPGTEAKQRIELAGCLFRSGDGGLIQSPRGHEHWRGFERGLSVAWRYGWGPMEVSRRLVLHPHQQAATLRWTVTGLEGTGGDAALHVGPMLTMRGFHGLLQRGDDPALFSTEQPRDPAKGNRLTVRHGPLSATFLASGGGFRGDGDWWYGVHYPVDAHRGQGDAEDYHLPGRFEVPLEPDADGRAEATLTVALGEKPVEPVEPGERSGRASTLKKLLPQMPGDGAEAKVWAIAADDFVVRRRQGKRELWTVLAGYPWFADWGRDTFIALPGLLLGVGRLSAARDVLRVFAGAMRGGLVPNRFEEDGGRPSYNTVDASLWFVHAGLSYIEASGKSPGWLVKAMRSVLDAYAEGTEAEDHDGNPVPIAMDGDGLVSAGHEGTQLTWMDAACGGVVFTPRPGKCVEVNALWYSGLVGLAALLESEDAEAAGRYGKRAAKVKRSFGKVFWSEASGRLLDHVRPDGGADLSLRPNQIFACSLARSPLPPAKAKRVLEAVKRGLLTPAGLRTLPPDDPAYHPRYGGEQFFRDEAYHQGTVWTWLIGPYAEAVLRAGKFSAKSRAEAAAALEPVVQRMMGQGLGQLHEIHDAEPSFGDHAPRGCIAQAWSVAEVLRVKRMIEGE